MAIFRKVHVSFWRDPFVKKLTPEQKYFYLYLMTNESSKQCGIYEIDISTMSYETGFNEQTVKKHLIYFSTKNKIKYSLETDEIAIKNWLKYNDSSSPKVKTCITNEIKKIKNKSLIEYVYSMDTRTQEEEEKEEEREKDPIQSLWIRTFGRNPKLPEIEETKKLIEKYGHAKVYEIYKSAQLKGFKNLGTLISALNENGEIIPRENKNDLYQTDAKSRYQNLD